MKSLFNSVELAKKIINLALENNMTITQLQLQKVMYYIQGCFMANYEYKAFEDKIECWTYGPVVRNVWDEFSKFGRRGIIEQETNIQLDSNQEELIIGILDEKLNMSVWDLVDDTHKEIPWKNAFKNKKRYLDDKDMVYHFSQN